MKESLEATLKDVELTKEVYRLYTLEHLTQQELCNQQEKFLPIPPRSS